METEHITLGKLRVWHIPQIPGKSFYVEVQTIDEGVRVCDILADYDLFQFDNKIKPDYSNASGIERFENDGVDEWGWFEVDTDFED